MTIYYLDPVNGLDTNDGLSMATAVKNFISKTIQPGSEMRAKASPDPFSLGQTASWTNKSRTVTLTSAVTQTIDNCESGWVASASVTVAHGSSTPNARQGTNWVRATPQSAFMTGLVAYKALPSTLNLSSYQQISFWVYGTQSTLWAATVAEWQIVLCSDAVGAVPVNSFTIPKTGNTYTAAWHAMTLDYGSALGSSINSVAIYTAPTIDPGTDVIYLDNIIACKAPSASDALSLRSLIGKNDTDNYWFPIKSIDGTTITIDNDTSSSPIAGLGFSGTTESATIHRREAFSTLETAISAFNTPVHAFAGSAASSSDSFSKYSGGWTDDTTQSGETWFDGHHGQGAGFNFSKNQIHLDRISFVRYNYTLELGTGSNDFYITNCSHAGAGTYGLNFTSANAWGTVENYRAINCTTGVRTSTGSFISLKNSHFCGGSAGVQVASPVSFSKCTFRNNSNPHIINSLGSSKTECHQCSFKDAEVVATETNPGDIYLYDCLLSDGAFVVNYSTSSMYAPCRVYSYNENQTGIHYTYSGAGTAAMVSDVVHDGAVSWRLSLAIAGTYSTNSRFYKQLHVATIYAKANTQTTVSVWMRRDHTAVSGVLVIPGAKISGVDDDISANITAAINTWQQVSISFTPTASGPVTIEARGYATGESVTRNLWVADVTIS